MHSIADAWGCLCYWPILCVFQFSIHRNCICCLDDSVTVFSSFMNEMTVLPNSDSQLQILMTQNRQSSMAHQNVRETCYLSLTESPRLRRCVLRLSKWGGGTQFGMQTLRENTTWKKHVRIILKSIFSK